MAARPFSFSAWVWHRVGLGDSVHQHADSFSAWVGRRVRSGPRPSARRRPRRGAAMRGCALALCRRSLTRLAQPAGRSQPRARAPQAWRRVPYAQARCNEHYEQHMRAAHSVTCGARRGRASGRWKRRTHAHHGISAVSKNTGSSLVLGMGLSSRSLRRAISASMTCARVRACPRAHVTGASAPVQTHPSCRSAP